MEAIRCGGFDFDAAIQTYVRNAHGVAIGERTAEAVKLTIGSAYPTRVSSSQRCAAARSRPACPS